jgi:ABC-type methionine transport system ATPase subunit
LLGLYRPESGRILYDGIDLLELEARSVRTQLGIVTQRPYLFGTSIRDNIALTDPSLGLDAVIRAGKLACIDEDIAAMAMGYETLLFDGGASLSGGQRQRIALARALAHSPSILLLDEATSELDALTERAVYENIADLGCTAIVIAHRLSTIAGADLIVVMEAGRVVERGTHEELLKLRGRYHELIASQREAVGAGGAGSPQRAAKLDALIDGLIDELSASTRSAAASQTASSMTRAVTRLTARRNDGGRTVTRGGNVHDVGSKKAADMPKKGDVHVIQSDKGWRVEVDGQSRASDTYRTQQAAWQQAKQIAQRNQSQALLHGRNGRTASGRRTHDPRRTKA